MSVFFVNADNGEVENDSAIPGSSTPIILSDAQSALTNFWAKVTEDIRKIDTRDFKNQALPLARIKKIMKLDDDVKMISAEAPLLFAKAAEIFIHELTLRAWIHTEDNKRRTLQRNDIAMAITKFDQFDFLIDIVPRDEIKPTKARDDGNMKTASMNPDQVHYYFQLAQQHQAALQQSATQTTAPSPTSTALPTIQIVQPNQQVQTMMTSDQSTSTSPAQTVSVATQQHPQGPTSSPTQVIQVQSTNQQTPQQSTSPQATGNIHIVQQIVGPNGEIQQLPIQLTPAQLQMIRMQMQGNSTQPIIIQTAPIQQPQIIQVAQQTPLYITPDNNTEAD